jgi:hypothetical protein
MDTLEVVISSRLWRDVNKNPEESLKRLEDKSLVKIDKDGVYDYALQCKNDCK